LPITQLPITDFQFLAGNRYMDLTKLPPAFLARMQELMSTGKLQLPPPVFVEMGAEIVDMSLTEKCLTVRFPVESRFQNPMGFMQGGMIAAAVDNVIGPLSFIVAPPSVTKTLTIEYLRPIPPDMAEIMVTARLVEEDGRQLTFTAEVKRGQDTVLAKATALNIVMRQREG
jgi:uncharacterized protein (TIGR00369 family)